MRSLRDLRACLCEGVPPGHCDDDSARRQWWAALATLQEDLLAQGQALQGLWIAAPLPALHEPQVLNRLKGWIWAPTELEGLLASAPPLLPAVAVAPPGQEQAGLELPEAERLALDPADGLDPLLLVITPSLQVGLCLDGPGRTRRLVVRFDAEVLSELLALVHERLEVQSPPTAERLRAELARLGALHCDGSAALRFWPRLAERLSTMAPSLTLQPVLPAAASATGHPELALLEALTHEVRTPLATIRTLIRSLLRRSDLSTVVRGRLEQIDSECSEQIDRFGLIFLATELQRQPEPSAEEAAGNLARTDLSALLEQQQPLWQRQLERRGLTLALQIAPELPPVLSDPARLETVLGGLIDRFGRSLPAGGRLILSLQPAGSRLKLQLSREDQGQSDAAGEEPRARVGPVLSWNPATGSLQLSREATQRLFQHLGSRLTERSDSGLTVFFPTASGR